MPKSILDIKNSIDCHLGNRIVLKANGGRKKTIERSGVLKRNISFSIHCRVRSR